MSRYVDADKLYDAVSDTWSGSRVIDTNDILEFIETFETADVREEKHGKWIDESTRHRFYVDTYSCSLCGHTFVFDNDETPEELEYSYCPKCGAKMDGDKND